MGETSSKPATSESPNTLPLPICTKHQSQCTFSDDVQKTGLTAQCPNGYITSSSTPAQFSCPTDELQIHYTCCSVKK